MRFHTICLLILLSFPVYAQPPSGTAPNPPVAVPQQEKIDLSSPAATVLSLASCLNRGDFRQAALCVADAQANADLTTHPAIAEWKKMGGTIALGTPQVTIRGSMAVAKLATKLIMVPKAGQPPATEIQNAERVLLTLVDGQWKVNTNVAMLAAEEEQGPNNKSAANKPPGQEPGNGLLTVLATVLAKPDNAIVGMRAARRSECASNLKQLAVAAHQMAAEFDDTFDIAGAVLKQKNEQAVITKTLPALWQRALFAYAKNLNIFLCPVEREEFIKKIADDAPEKARLQNEAQKLGVRELFPPQAYESYAFNTNLNGAELKDIKAPADTVLLYEGREGKLSFRHDGKANVAFVDGHVMAITAEDAKELIWNPKGN